ncbi:transposase, partial [Tannerella forsythia]|uniref:transposase n=1 Tax=Tannerella forsythia TaxID=28112 RepID=UPI0021AB848A
ASTVAELYKSRWQIEIFFRNLKQLLRIKSFIGTSRNAVETQIWTALTTMLLLCWLKHTARYKWGLANLVVSLRLNTFTKMDPIRGKGGSKLLFFRWALYLNGVTLAHNLFRTTLL